MPVQGCTLPLPNSTAISLLPLWAVQPVQSLSACTRVHFIYCLHAKSVWYNRTINAIFVCTVVDIQTAFQMHCQCVRSVFSLPHYMYLAHLLGTAIRPVPNEEFHAVAIFLFYSNKCCIVFDVFTAFHYSRILDRVLLV